MSCGVFSVCLDRFTARSMAYAAPVRSAEPRSRAGLVRQANADQVVALDLACDLFGLFEPGQRGAVVPLVLEDVREVDGEDDHGITVADLTGQRQSVHVVLDRLLVAPLDLLQDADVVQRADDLVIDPQLAPLWPALRT